MPFPLLAIGLMAGGQLLSGMASGEAKDNAATQNRIAAVRRRLKASIDARDALEQGRRFQASQAVAFAKSGVLLDQGSPLAVLMDTAIAVERDAMRIRIAGEYDAENYEATAAAYNAAGRADRIAGAASAVGTMISGAASMQTQYRPPSTTPRTGT